ncbi:MAG: protease inhibitor I42 family protein [Massilia sp.]
MIVVDESAAGSSVDVAAGDVLAIRLKENATTGYRWTLETGDGVTMEESIRPGATPGAGGMHEFRLRAANAGKRQLRWKHWRDWQGDDSIIGRFEIEARFQ